MYDLVFGSEYQPIEPRKRRTRIQWNHKYWVVIVLVIYLCMMTIGKSPVDIPEEINFEASVHLPGEGKSQIWNAADPTARYGVTPITYEQTIMPKRRRAAVDLSANHPLTQIWYDPTNPKHAKTTARLRELGVDPEEILETGWDWSTVGAMTPVKDQARTGTCWMFSATAVAESAWWMSGGDLTKFSPQVVGDCLALRCKGEYCNKDRSAAINASMIPEVKACFGDDCNFAVFDNYAYCDGPFNARGCDARNGWGGGEAIDAFRYFWHRGFVRDEDYPFRHCAPHDWEYKTRGMDRKKVCRDTAPYCYWDETQEYPFSKCMLGLPSSLPCKTKHASNPVGSISGIFIVSETDKRYYQGKAPTNLMSEERMRHALVNLGPLAIGITSDPMHYYQGGIMDLPEHLCAREGTDHAITLVGFGEENGVKYWKIQNSWGSLWGENGYARIRRGKNICGIATSATGTWV